MKEIIFKRGFPSEAKKATTQKEIKNVSIYDSRGNLIESNRNILNKLAEYAGEDFTGKKFTDIIQYFKNSKQLA